MGTGRSNLRRVARAEQGFTIIEAMVAVTILSVAIVLSIQPVMGAMRGISDARVISVGENLAQAEVEVIRSLSYEQIGLPGRTPSGSLAESREVIVEGRTYLIELDIQYAGSVTGLDVIPQGGDGVQGSWDPGVDYKVARVTVTAEGRESDPIVMETIISPTKVGQHEGIANARVFIAAHEPFASSGADLPQLKIQAPPGAALRSGMAANEQVWPGIAPGAYTVTVEDPNGWIIHPQDLIDGLDQLTVVSGTTAETTLRVYRPGTFEIEVLDSVSHDPVTGARLTLTDLESGVATAYTPGEYVIANLRPDAYGVKVTASGYVDWTLTSLNIPANYPDPYHKLTVYIDSITSPTTTTTTTTTTPTTTTTTTIPSGGSTTTSTSTTTTTTSTTTTAPGGTRVPVEFTVIDDDEMVIAGALVSIDHAWDGPFSAVTDVYGRVSFNLLDDEDYVITGSTQWGHGPDTDWLTVGNSVDDLELSRPSGQGMMTLKSGADAEFVYRQKGQSTWTVMPANYRDKASFVDDSGKYEVGKRCIANGQVVGVKEVSVSKNKNKSTSISTNCPQP
jgi:type II secretory pathway pseudopilin PulG